MREWKTVFLFLLVLLMSAPLFSAAVPDTGQTKCYNASVEIPCPSSGQDFYGQDGNYTINPPSYTKLDSNGNALSDSATSWAMVKDNVTGLIWEVKTGKDGVKNYIDPHDADNTYIWYDSNPMTNGGYAGTPGDGTDTENFIKTLNDASYGGHSDWRLPTITELAYIVDQSIPYPAASWYWSSTTYVGSTSHAWIVDFYSGYVYSTYKVSYHYVRAVRGGQSGTFGNSVIGSFDSVNNVAIQSTVPAGGFTDNGDDTVTDSSTGLVWQQETPDTEMEWNDALAYSEGLSLGGHDDWRLPNSNELLSLVNYCRNNPAIDISYFTHTGEWYWSSATNAHSTNDAWGVNFSYGSGSNNDKVSYYYVRAVRGGQNRLLGHLFISAPAQAAFLSIGTNTLIQWETSGISGNVAVTLSRDGGKAWETIIASTLNDGSHPWTVTGPESVNCMLKIEPVSNPSKGTVQGLFTVYGTGTSQPTPVGEERGKVETTVPANQDMLLMINSTNIYGDIPVYEWFVLTAFMNGIGVPLFILSDTGIYPMDDILAELYLYTFLFDSSGVTTIGVLTMADLGLASGDALVYGYAYQNQNGIIILDNVVMIYIEY